MEGVICRLSVVQQVTPSEPTILSPQQQKIYEMQMKGYKIKEIAEVLGVGCGAVKKQLWRIRKKQEKYKGGLDDALAYDDLLHLSGRQQQVVYLRRNGYKIKDAAKILGISASTARQHSYRAKQEKNTPIKEYILSEEELQAVKRRSEERNRPVSRDLVSMVFKLIVEKEKITREELLCLGNSGFCPDYDARSAAQRERARSFAALTLPKQLIYIENEDVLLVEEVVEEFFVHVKDSLYKPRVEAAQEVLRCAFEERIDILRKNDAVLIRKTNDAAPGKAYAMKLIEMVTPEKSYGKVVGIKKNAVIIEGNPNIIEIKTSEVVIYHKKVSYAVSHMMLREGDMVIYGRDNVILQNCVEDWPTKIIVKY